MPSVIIQDRLSVYNVMSVYVMYNHGSLFLITKESFTCTCTCTWALLVSHHKREFYMYMYLSFTCFSSQKSVCGPWLGLDHEHERSWRGDPPHLHVHVHERSWRGDPPHFLSNRAMFVCSPWLVPSRRGDLCQTDAFRVRVKVRVKYLYMVREICLMRP